MSVQDNSQPTDVNDAARLLTLDSYSVLDTQPEQSFDDVAELAALACETPVALVSLVTGDRQWFKANVGFSHCQTDLNSSVCAHALGEDDLFVIPDLTADPRTRANPLVTGEPYIRFYAGAPLRNGEGVVLGTLCVIDTAPRPDGLTARQSDMLRKLGRQVMTLLDLRRVVVGRDRFIARRRRADEQIGRERTRLQLSEAHWRGLFERLSEGLILAEVIRDPMGHVVDWRYLDVNRAWGDLVGIDPSRVVGQTLREAFPEIEAEWVTEAAQVVTTGEAISFVRRAGPLDRWYEGRMFPLEGDRFAILFLEVTQRVHGDLRRNALLEIGDQLRDLTAVEQMTRAASAIVGQALGVTRAGFGRLEEDGKYVVIEPDWTAPGMSSIAGRHRFADYGDIAKELLLGEPLIVRDMLVDTRTSADQAQWLASDIRSLVNMPIQERGRTVALILVHDTKPRDWSPGTIAFLRNVGDRLAAGVARLEAEKQQVLLNEELSHRMKNMLAMVQAIAAQTLKGVSERDAVDAFRQRLHALSSAHDVLLQKRWASAQLVEVAQAVLSQSSHMDQIRIKGPSVLLGPRATLSVSLLLHELATNAVKYGALSVHTGSVTVSWSVETPSNELVLQWIEAGGPEVAEPSGKGFGSKLLRGGLIGTGGVSLRYKSSGLQAEMRARLEHLQTT